jgi:hypothetical protein
MSTLPATVSPGIEGTIAFWSVIWLAHVLVALTYRNGKEGDADDE